MVRFFFAILFFTCVSSGALGQDSKGDLFYAEGKVALDQGSNENAVKKFQDARAAYLKEKNYKRYFVATQAISIIYQDTGQGAEAEKIVLEAIQVTPGISTDHWDLHAQLQDNLAYTYLNVLSKPEKALLAYDAAIANYVKAGKANTTDIAFEYYNRAVTLYTLSRFEASANDMLIVIEIYKQDSETSAGDLASYHHTLALSYIALENFDQALKSLQQSLILIPGNDQQELQSAIYNSIGNVYSAQGLYQKALESFQKARIITEVLFGGDSEQLAANLINIGNAQKDMGDLETSLTTYQQVLTIYQKSPSQSADDLIDLFLNISRVTDDLGLADKSKQITEQALALAVSSFGKGSIAEANIYQHMGAGAYNNGQFDESLSYNFKALSILDVKRSSKASDDAMLYNNIGMAYDELNDIELALKYKEQAVTLYTKIYGRAHPLVAMAIGNIGLSYARIDQYDQSLKFLKESLEILRGIGETAKEDLGITYLDIGTICLKKKDIKTAFENLERARMIFDVYTKNVNKTKIYNRLGLAYTMLNDLKKADHCYQQAIVANVFDFNNATDDAFPESPEFIKFYEIIVSYIGKADVNIKRGDKGSLLKAEKQLEAVDKLLLSKATDLQNGKDRLELAELNSFFTASGTTLMSKLFGLTQNLQYLEKAFYFMERSKANELLADMQLSRATSLSKIPKKLLARHSASVTRLNTLRQQIASAYSSQNQLLITRLKAQEFDLVKAYDDLQSQIISLSPTVSAVINQRKLPSWNDVKHKLDPKAAVVSYLLTDSAKFVLIGNGSKLMLRSLPARADVDKLMRGYTNAIKFQSPALKQILEKLTDVVWAPVTEALKELPGVERVIILPEGSLNHLPFETLGQEKYLIELYTIQYHLSAAMLLQSGSNTTKKSKPSLIAMAPVFKDKETNYVNKSCQRFVQLSKKSDSTSRAFSLNGEYINPLPATEDEVQKINRLHTDKGSLTKFFLEEEAHEELIKKGELEHYDYIHLATHGFVNTAYPELSGLLLTQDPKSAEDGILYSGEILGLSLQADLVTLSACETGLGKTIEGEGIRGLSTAFILAGAKNVIASYWKVADESTSRLMIDFYTELSSGKDKASALRSAKIKLLQSTQYNHPYYWAPFVQLGIN